MIDWYNKKISLTGKNIVITIDDGNLSQYVYAVPLLEKYGFNATIFVVTSRINDYKVTWNPKKNQFFSIIKEILGGLNMAFKFKKLFEDNDDEIQSVSEDEFYSISKEDAVKVKMKQTY